MDDLVAFLRARLAEDEEAARAATPGPWVAGTTSGLLVDNGVYGQGDGGSLEFACDVREASWDWKRGNVAHIARHSPARVLAEVEAKRRVLADFEEAVEGAAQERRLDAATWRPVVNILRPVVQGLALPFVDHPDYRPEWRP